MKVINTSSRMPIMFVGHGNPMNAIEDTSYSAEWERIGRELPRPASIVILSAHWMTHGRSVLAMSHPKMLYDFYGFPKELSSVVYPVLGNPLLAKRIVSILPETKLVFDRGLDHGAWSILKRMFPEADIPVIQISFDATQTLMQEYVYTGKLRPLRNEGVLFVGSGNIIHNLSAMNGSGEPATWALDFDVQVKKYLEAHDDISLFHPELLGANASRSIPTDEHYRPMVSILALRESDERWEFFNEQIDLGSIGMRSFVSR